jgi:hypothetical protein
MISQAHAQTTPTFDLRLSPSRAYLQVKPGEEFVHTVEIEQRGSTTLEATAEIVDFQPDMFGQAVLQTSSSVPFVKVSPAQLTLVPGRPQTVTLTIGPGTSAREQEYPLSLLVTAKPDPSFSVAPQETAVTGRGVSHMILLVSPTTTARGRLTLESFEAPKFIDSFQAFSFSAAIKNSGLHATPASGSASITSWWGSQIYSARLFPDMILGNSSRQVRVQDSSAPDSAALPEYKPWFALGPYTLELKTENATSPGDSASRTVIAVPISVLGVILIFSLLLLINRAFRRYTKARIIEKK